MSSVDLNRVREVADGDEQFFQELFTIFLDDAAQQIHVLRQAVEQHDATAVRRTAHRLKGASSNVGARPFSSLCLRLEQTVGQGSLDQVPSLILDMQEEYARLQQFLAQLPRGGP